MGETYHKKLYEINFDKDLKFKEYFENENVLELELLPNNFVIKRSKENWKNRTLYSIDSKNQQVEIVKLKNETSFKEFKIIFDHFLCVKFHSSNSYQIFRVEEDNLNQILEEYQDINDIYYYFSSLANYLVEFSPLNGIPYLMLYNDKSISIREFKFENSGIKKDYKLRILTDGYFQKTSKYDPYKRELYKYDKYIDKVTKIGVIKSRRDVAISKIYMLIETTTLEN